MSIRWWKQASLLAMALSCPFPGLAADPFRKYHVINEDSVQYTLYVHEQYVVEPRESNGTVYKLAPGTNTFRQVVPPGGDGIWLVTRWMRDGSVQQGAETNLITNFELEGLWPGTGVSGRALIDNSAVAVALDYPAMRNAKGKVQGFYEPFVLRIKDRSLTIENLPKE
jgi:hypothetical protein